MKKEKSCFWSNPRKPPSSKGVELIGVQALSWFGKYGVYYNYWPHRFWPEGLGGVKSDEKVTVLVTKKW